MKVTFYFITWKHSLSGEEYVCNEDGYAFIYGRGVSGCLLSSKPLPPNSRKRAFNLYMLEVENDEVANICPCNW